MASPSTGHLHVWPVHSHVLLQVREACSVLDIDVMYYPCPANGPTYRAQAAKENGTGKSQHPFMKDPNTGT